MNMGMEVNADISAAVGCLAHQVPSVPSHALGEEAHGPLPGDLRRPSGTSQGHGPRYRGLAPSPALPESWVARGWFPSPPFPDPNRDVSGSAWEGPDLPGPGGGNGVAMTASFRFLAFPSCAPSSRSPLSLPEGLPLWPRAGRGESRLFPAGGSPLHAWPTMWRSPQASPSPNSGFPKAHARRAAGGGLPPQEKSAGTVHRRPSSWSSFPVINGGAASQLLLKMLHPQPVPLSGLGGGAHPGQSRSPPRCKLQG